MLRTLAKAFKASHFVGVKGESSQGSPKLQSQECYVQASYLAVHMEILSIKLVLPAIRQRNLL